MALNTGELLYTSSLAELAQSNQAFSLFMMEAFTRHKNLDYGDICDQDKRINEDAVSSGGRIMSSYKIPEELTERCRDDKVWIITEAENQDGNRLCTTILFPSEY